jgi:MinD superfamily P-loop ATPase
MKIAISSGKGGTGKTLVATNIAAILSSKGQKVTYMDCDVEEPNGHLFLRPEIEKEEDVTLLSPIRIDDDKCINCGKCSEACTYNAIAAAKGKVLLFPELCHVCGACEIVCPTNAIVTGVKKIGTIKHGKSRGAIDFHYALLETAEGGMSPRLIKKVKACSGQGINIYDSPPGTACPVVATVKDVDLCVLVTDPTPFGVNDLMLAVDMCREIGQEPVVLVNRAEYLDDALKTYCIRESLEIIGEVPDDRRIAEVYSKGDLVVDKLPQYLLVFEAIADKIVMRANIKKKVTIRKKAKASSEKITRAEAVFPEDASKHVFKEIVVISGKGGTGKTSLTACFAALAGKSVITDCDVDAADLHLVLSPEIKKSGDFSGGVVAEIDQSKCTGCGRCKEACRFSAIEVRDGRYYIDPVACEGCGVCELVCANLAVKTKPAVNGQWYVSETRFGPMSHARLGVAEENSGRLVTLVRQNAAALITEGTNNRMISDGAPGTGCPVIASLSGVDYALIVTEPTVSGMHDLKRILDVTGHFGVKSGVIVNKHDINPAITEEIRAVTRDYKSSFLGLVPYDKSVTQAQMKKISLVEYIDALGLRKQSQTLNNIEQIWEELCSDVFGKSDK